MSAANTQVKYLFRDAGTDFFAGSHCAVCQGEPPADIELWIDGKLSSYVCSNCLRAAHRCGIEGWKRRLCRRARQMELLAARMREVAGRIPNGDCNFELPIYEDAFHSWTAIGPLEYAAAVDDRGDVE
jgi:hypothetical protein